MGVNAALHVRAASYVHLIPNEPPAKADYPGALQGVPSDSLHGANWKPAIGLHALFPPPEYTACTCQCQFVRFESMTNELHDVSMYEAPLTNVLTIGIADPSCCAMRL